VVFYIFIVAVLNIGLGFALAVYTARRHRLLMEMGGGTLNGIAVTARPSVAAPQASTPSPVAATPLPTPPPDQASEDNEATPAAVAATVAAEPAAADSQPLADDAPLQAAGDEASAGPGQQCVANFQAELDGYRNQVTEANEVLRSYMGTADPSDIEACLQSLMEATNDYLDHRQQVQQGFEDLHDQHPQLNAVNDELQSAIEQQDLEIKKTATAIENFDYEGPVEDGRQAMVGQTSKLLDSSHRLSDTLDQAMVEVARSENGVENSPPSVRVDRLTGVLSRAGFEAILAQWWQADPQHTRPMSVATIDLDEFAQINEQFGHRLGDELLRAVGQLLEAERRGEIAIARFSGQRFFLMFPDADLRSATNTVERIRQMIEITVVEHQQAEIRLTVSCGVTEAAAADTSEILFARAEATLREAKRYGRNRTFLHEGKFPTPVVPPNFALEPRRLTL
jgi:diguanylate cyclase